MIIYAKIWRVGYNDHIHMGYYDNGLQPAKWVLEDMND